MQLGRIIGKVWASVKNPGLTGQRLLIVQPVKADLAPGGKCLICTDSTGAGAGELIYWVRGKEASFPFTPDEVASDATVVGIVDELNLGKRSLGER
ncbi:MAG: EutN/CcmL family microcompartment protein [Acidobacteria bacterium]|nr:EutN/CcmL family microcompartment protein [Acidobacteriota bacterium]